MSPLTAAAGNGASAALRKDTPSACSSPHRGGERERAAAAEHFFQRRKAELGKFCQRLPRNAAARDFLTDRLGDLPALLGGKLLVRRRHRHPCSACSGILEHVVFDWNRDSQ
jgi:hypothetical protein